MFVLELYIFIFPIGGIRLRLGRVVDFVRLLTKTVDSNSLKSGGIRYKFVCTKSKQSSDGFFRNTTDGNN